MAAGDSGSKNGLAPLLGVGGSGAKNAAPDEASARAELDLADGSCSSSSASALRFFSALGSTVGSAFRPPGPPALADALCFFLRSKLL